MSDRAILSPDTAVIAVLDLQVYMSMDSSWVKASM